MTLSAQVPKRFILLIDDDADDLELLCEALTEIDTQIICHTASNGEEGLNILKTVNLPTPEIIFADLNMPKMDGLHFLQSIKAMEQFDHIPVVIYSTSIINEEQHLYYEAGAELVIEKPVSYDKLKASLIPIIRKSVTTY